ncbi:MAG TPA: DinB family protein [Candidatus Sulfopaludibacter sp.]|nr:DinB family protein [Candidatus Sulfopaludibacter sp.]
MSPELSRIFLDYSAEKLHEHAQRIEDCLGRLTDEQVWVRGGENENAVGNLVLHLCGNVRQWIVSGVGSQPDIRKRDEEFAARGSVPVAQLVERLRAAVAEANAVVRGVTPERMSQPLLIQGYNVTVMEAIYHVVEHFSGHAGQILFVTKMLTGADLAYYGHLSAAARNQAR